MLGEPKIDKSSLLHRLAHDWDGEVIGPIDFQELEDREDFYTTLAEALGLVDAHWRVVRQRLRECRTLLLLDELDVGLNRGFDGADLGRFRALCGGNRGLKVIAVARRPLKEVFGDSGVGSPGYNFLLPYTLGAMPDEEARLLLGHPRDPATPGFDASTLDELLSMGAGHPFRLQPLR